MCRYMDGDILTDERMVKERWKQYYDEHLNTNVAGNITILAGAEF